MAIHLSQFVKELHGVYSRIDGLILLLDTCYAGIAAADAAHKWTSGLESRLRYQVATAASDRPAYDACFSRAVTEVIRNGSQVARSDYLYFTAFQGLLAERCKHQQSQFVGSSRGRDDSTLWLAKNVARLPSGATWIRSAAAAEIKRLTACFQPTPELDSIVAASEEERCVAVVGDAGTGKSALAAALARAEVAEGHVREGFVQAIAFLSKSTTSGELASQLAEQLERSMPQAFAAAREQFLRHTVYEERQRLGPLEREVVGPLRWLEKDRPVRIVIDGLDRLSEVTGATRTVLPALNLLVTDAALAMIRLVATSRPDTPLPVGAKLLHVGVAEDTYIGSYLRRRDIPARHQATIISRARGNWLVARLLAELVTANPEADPLTLPRDLVEILRRRFGSSWSLRTREVAKGAPPHPGHPRRCGCGAGNAIQAALRSERETRRSGQINAGS